jgi:hypothetical protein
MSFSLGVDTLALVGALLLVEVPLEVALAEEILHGVAADVLAVEAALAHTRAVAEVVVLLDALAAVVGVAWHVGGVVVEGTCYQVAVKKRYLSRGRNELRRTTWTK